MNILIAGCGKIGNAVGQALTLHGHQVFGIRRNISGIAPNITPISIDLSKPVMPESLPTHIDQVIYILSASEFNEAAYRLAYIEGASRLIDALGEKISQLNRFIFVSSSSVYGQNDGEWVDENSSTEPRSFNGQIMLEAEQQILNLPNALIVRFSGIYGPGRNRMLEQVKSGQLASAQPKIYSNRIHSKDCQGVLTYLSTHSDIDAPLIVASDCQPSTLHDVHNWLADKLQVPQSRRQYQQPKRRAGSKRISNQRLLDLGYQFQYQTFRQGYGEILGDE